MLLLFISFHVIISIVLLYFKYRLIYQRLCRSTNFILFQWCGNRLLPSNLTKWLCETIIQMVIHQFGFMPTLCWLVLLSINRRQWNSKKCIQKPSMIFHKKLVLLAKSENISFQKKINNKTEIPWIMNAYILTVWKWWFIALRKFKCLITIFFYDSRKNCSWISQANFLFWFFRTIPKKKKSLFFVLQLHATWEWFQLKSIYIR